MSAQSSQAPPLFGQEIEGLNGLHLALYQRYRDLFSALDPLRAATLSAYTDDDLPLCRRYERSYRHRLQDVQRWMDLARDVLRVPEFAAVADAIEEEIERDRLISETIDMLRAATRRADEAMERADAALRAANGMSGEMTDGASQEGGATAADAGPPARGPRSGHSPAAENKILQNEMHGDGGQASAQAGPDTARVETTARGSPRDTAREASAPEGLAQTPGTATASGTATLNDVPRRPRKLLMNGAGSWTEPIVPRPLIIMGREVFQYEQDWD